MERGRGRFYDSTQPQPQLPSSRCRLYFHFKVPLHSNFNFPAAKNTWYILQVDSLTVYHHRYKQARTMPFSTDVNWPQGLLDIFNVSRNQNVLL